MGRWLDWAENGFDRFKMESIETPSVANECFFHAILYDFFIPYRMKREAYLEVDQSRIVQELRKNLSLILALPINPLNRNQGTVYQHLARGKLEEISKALPEYSLRSMQARLESASPIGLEFLELISDVLSKDIIILDSTTKDVYFPEKDDGILYKNRDTVVILYNRPVNQDGIGHYESIGLRVGGSLQTHFSSEHSFIKFLKERLRL